MTILVVGEALVDVVRFADGSVSEHAGGSPFNVAVGLGRLGAEVTLAAQIGCDAHGAMLCERLADAGVSLDQRGPLLSRTSTATATLAADGSAAYVFDIAWNPDSLPDPAVFEAVHVGSLGTALAPGADLVADLVRRACASGVPVTFDPNVRLTVESDAASWQSVAERLLPDVSIIKLSEEDAAAVRPEVDPVVVVRGLVGDRRLVVLTRGAEGLVLGARSGTVEVPATAARVVDTIGAGDSVTSAILVWCQRRGWPAADELTCDDLRDLGSFAAAAAAVTVSRRGAEPPTLPEVAIRQA
jgi:fructokinase